MMVFSTNHLRIIVAANAVNVWASWALLLLWYGVRRADNPVR
jgi:hypothetical protein